MKEQGKGNLIEKIEDVGSYDPKKQTDAQLRDDWRIVTAWYSTILEGKEFKHTKDEVEEIASKIVLEIWRRGAAKLRPRPGRGRLLFAILPRIISDGIEVDKETFEEIVAKDFGRVELGDGDHPVGKPVYVISEDLIRGIFTLIGESKEEPGYFDYQLNAIIEPGLEYKFESEEEIESITPDVLRNLSDEELMSLSSQLHFSFSLNPVGREREAILNAYSFLVSELDERGIEDQIFDRLVEEWEKLSKVQSDLLKILEDMPDFIYIQNYVSLVGSSVGEGPEYVKAKGEPNDIDILIREQMPDASFELKIARLFPSREMRRKLHFVYYPEGPNWSFLPLYDLVLKKKSRLEVEILDEPDYQPYGSLTKARIRPGKPFGLMKARTGYHKGEFFLLDSLWDLWARGIIESGDKIAIEPKFDGIRLSIHKDGDRVWIFTEDAKRDRASIMPEVVEDVKMIKASSAILDGEMVWWEKGRPIPRHEMIAIVSGKEPLSGVDLRYNAFDALYFQGDDLQQLEWSKRQEFLRKIIPENMRHLFKVEPIVVSNKAELENAFRKAKQYPGSEGAMFKATKGIYESNGEPRTASWAKLKLVKEIKVQVIGVRRKKPSAIAEKPSETFLYRVAFKGDDGLVPIESESKITPKKLEEEKEWKMASGWERTDGYSYGKTYATNVKAELGDIITVIPIGIRSWIGEDGEEHYSWMFPIVKEVDKTRDEPDDLKDVEKIIAASKLQKAIGEKLDGKPEDEPTREEQIAIAEGKRGDWYMVEQPKGKSFDFVAMHHMRGILTPDRTSEVKKFFSGISEWDQTAVNKVWRDSGLSRLIVPMSELKEKARSIQNEGGNVGEVISDSFQGSPPQSKEEYESWLKDDEIVMRGNAHVDLRMRKPDENSLIGWTLDTPGAIIQRYSDPGKIEFILRDKFFENMEKDNIVSQKKAEQPLSWLTVVSPEKKEYWAPPGWVGGTEKTAGLFHFMDRGRVVYGNQKSDYHEYFLFFEKLKGLNGRWGVQQIAGDYEKAPPIFWMTNRPPEQRPYILTHDKEEEEQKAKKEKIEMIWNENTIPTLKGFGYEDLDEEEIEKSVRIIKVDDEKRIVTGAVLKPRIEDLQGDTISAEEIEEAMIYWMMKGGKIGLDHAQIDNDGKRFKLIECYVAPQDLKINDANVKKGTWIISVKVLDVEVWRMIKDGELRGFSMSGWGRRS